MDRYHPFLLLIISAFLIAGILAAAPDALAMEEFLVSLSTDINNPISEPEVVQDMPVRSDDMSARRITWQSMRNKRFPELTSRHIIIIARNKQGEEINQSVLLDPRLIRAEIFSPVSGQIVASDQNHDENVDFIVDFGSSGFSWKSRTLLFSSKITTPCLFLTISISFVSNAAVITASFSL